MGALQAGLSEKINPKLDRSYSAVRRDPCSSRHLPSNGGDQADHLLSTCRKTLTDRHYKWRDGPTNGAMAQEIDWKIDFMNAGLEGPCN
jgi:hypothetical protein